MSPTRLAAHPPAPPPRESQLSLSATMTACFQLTVVPDLFDPDNDALADAWLPARRLLVVRDGVAGDRGGALAGYLRAARKAGRLEDFLILDAHDDRAAGGIDACDDVVDAATRVRLGRRDAFVAFGSARTSQVVTVAASSYRRWTPALRLHRDLPSVVASVRDGVRVGLSDAPISALLRASTVIVDEQGVLAGGVPGPDEHAAMLLLGLLDADAVDGLGSGSTAERRAEALATVLRLCQRTGPGGPRWQLGAAWLPLAPPEVPLAHRQPWALMVAARLAHRLGMLSAERLAAASLLVHRLHPALLLDVMPVPDEQTVHRFAASRALQDGGALTVPLPGDDGDDLVSVGLTRLSTALTDLPGLAVVPPVGAAPLRRPPAVSGGRAAHADLRIRAAFPVRFAHRLLDDDNWELADLLPVAGQVLAAVDPYSPEQLSRVHRLLARYRRHGYLSRFAVVPVHATDGAKTLDQVARLVQVAEGLGLTSADRILAVGGGTVLDVAGYAAYLYRGDTPYVRVPTTLVGMIDAGVGLKVGVNVNGHKNLMGAYHPALACVCDPTFLSTLAPADLRCGLAEATKISMVCDRALFELIEARHADLLAAAGTSEVRAILDGSIATMLRQLETNPFEEDLRRLPDFGHEFGHLLESMSGFRLRHGEAVSIGMSLSSCLAVSAGYLDPADRDRMLALLRVAGLPVWDRVCDPDVLWTRLREDVMPNKGGQLHLVVPRAVGIGDFIDSIDDLDVGMLRDACTRLRGLEEGS